MTTPSSRRQFLTTSTLAAAGTVAATSLSAQDAAPATGKGPSLEGRIFKAVKGGKQGGETPLQFFERLKKLGFDAFSAKSSDFILILTPLCILTLYITFP